MGERGVIVFYFGLAVVAGLAAGLNLGEIPISSVIVVGSIGAAVLVRHRYFAALPTRRLQLTWLVIYLLLALPLAVTLGNPPF